MKNMVQAKYLPRVLLAFSLSLSLGTIYDHNRSLEKKSQNTLTFNLDTFSKQIA
jgi:hypothetical protein